MPTENHFSIDEAAALRRFDTVIWGVIGVVAAIVLLSPIITNFQIIWGSFVLPGFVSVLLIAGSWYYDKWRYEPRLSSALGGTAQFMVFAAAAAPLSYLAASFGLPLQDGALDAADKALGFDWMALLASLNAHPTMFTVLRAIYMSLSIQATLIILCLAFTGRLAWLRIFILAFMGTAIVTIAISAVLPAQGPWSHYGLTAADPSSIVPATWTVWPVFHGLRDGTYRQLMAAGAEGVITFPSLHAALAVILIMAMWPIARLRWLALGVNAAMLAATPIDGSHYLVDILAGIVIAILSFAASRAALRRMATDPTLRIAGRRLAAGGQVASR